MSLAGMLLESYRSQRVFMLGGRGLSRRQSSGGGRLMALAGGRRRGRGRAVGECGRCG